MLISIETHITCDFPGGRSGTPFPLLWIHTTLSKDGTEFLKMKYAQCANQIKYSSFLKADSFI